MTPGTAYFPIGHVTGEFIDNGRRLTLTQPFLYFDGPERVFVPAGFVTDFNSVPRGLWNFFPPWDYPEAGVTHDWLYRNPGGRNRQICDRVHRRILEIEGASRFFRGAAYSQLRMWGWKPWNGYREADRGCR